MDCGRYSAASRHEVLLDEDEFRSFLQALELGDVLLPLQLSVTVLALWNQFCVPLFDPFVTGFPVSVRSFSTCPGVNTQRSVDSCPDTGFPVLVGSVTLSCFSWLRVSRSNLVRSRVSSIHQVTGLPALDNWVLGFSSIRGCLYCFLQHQNPNCTSNYLCRKSSVVVEVTLTLSGIWFLQISPQLLSRYKKLGVYRGGWLRSILFDRTSILFVEQAVYRPNTPYLGALSTFTCKMQDVVWSDEALLDLGDSYAWDSRL